MSGAQGKAAEIAKAVAIVAEVDRSRIETRHSQGWISQVTDSAEEAVKLAQAALEAGESTSIAYHGNIVDCSNMSMNIKFTFISCLTKPLATTSMMVAIAQLASALKNGHVLLAEDKETFRRLVDETLARHFAVIKALTAKGTYFFDYGNAFMKSVYDSGIKEISKNGFDDKDGFIWPSYVEDIMGPMLFDYGYGSFPLGMSER